jgi:CIC family chloride channel protein
MEMVMNKFEKSKKPSYRSQGREIFWFYFKSVALEAYRTKLKSMTIE